MPTPLMSTSDLRTRQTFAALMWALNYPGRSYVVPGYGLDAFGAIAETLVDLETSCYSASPEVRQMLVRTGAQVRPPDAAHYHFYPELDATLLPVLGEAPTGSYAYPDESATLVIGCTLDTGYGLRLSGPGIPIIHDIWVDGIPEAFWRLRERACQYPLGWDIFLVSQNDVIGLPRTTRIEVS